ncbi:MAG: DUF4399 domain-containing protein [Acidimicrobiales bacterium]
MRGRRRAAVLVAAVAASAAAMGACGGDDSAEAARELRRRTAGQELEVKGVPEGGILTGNTVELEPSGAGVRIVEPDGDTSGRTGHYVVFLDRDPVPLGDRIPEAGENVVEAFESPIQLTGLTPGRHTVSVVLSDGARRRIGETEARTEMTVQQPTLSATAEDVEAKDPVVIDVEVQGAQLVEPNGDTSGTTGHLAVFIDREPTAVGAPVPQELGIVFTAQDRIVLEDLGGGEHELWVVLVNGAGVPFDPMVADKVTVEVG